MSKLIMLKKKKSYGDFRVGEHAVHPLHGVGLISEISEIKIIGKDIECLILKFPKNNLTVFVPVNKIEAQGLRVLISDEIVKDVIKELKMSSKFLRVIWNRRSKEYEGKIQSGCIMACVDVVRDLYKNTNNPNRSYTEAIIYEEAFYRVVSELAIVQNAEYNSVASEINVLLNKYHETYQSMHSNEEAEEAEDEVNVSSFEEEDFKQAANG